MSLPEPVTIRPAWQEALIVVAVTLVYAALILAPMFTPGAWFFPAVIICWTLAHVILALGIEHA